MAINLRFYRYEIKKQLTNPLVIIVLIIFCCIGIFAGYLMEADNFRDALLNNSLLFSSFIYYITMIAGMLLIYQFESGAIADEISHGICRRTVFFAKIIVYTVIMSFGVLGCMIFNCICAAIKNNGIEYSDIMQTLKCAVAIEVVAISFFVLFGVIALCLEHYVSYIICCFIVNIIVSFAGSVQIKWITRLYDYTLFSQFDKIVKYRDIKMMNICTISAIWIGLALICSYLIFEKKELY